ncbi:MAG: hypothetical protein GY799_21910 [Desulfobulbaceae bacterium]|nr:hypothetical protein [Desulfobulbaceae bacterium]
MEHYLARIILRLLLAIFVVLPQTSDAQEDKVSEVSARQDVSWAELVFKGSKLMNKITVKIKLTSGDELSDDQATKIGGDPDDCSETVSGSKLLTVQSSSKGVGSSSGQYKEEIWFNEKDIHPDKRIRLNSGDAPWVKSYCWEDNGVRRLKILPGKSSEKKYPPSKWTKRTESFYEHPADASGCATISDPSLIFYMISMLDLDRQEPFEICVFGRKQLHRVTIGQEKASAIKVSYKERPSSKEVAVKDTITAVVFSITTDNFASGGEKQEAYSFLGLNKDIRIFMDPEKRLPIRISGANNSIGGLVLDLKLHSKPVKRVGESQ